ncbi:MAG: LysR family transcriptional regulator [Lentisphaeria bacterium]|nr:LysR family transcriptional regulator [Lentisphaeria bacterium]
MELRVLKYFLAVAQEGSLTAAARRLRITQPTLSRQLKELEDELGRQLYTRGSHHVSLTADGLLLRKRAEEIMDIVGKTKTEFESAHEIAGDIHIGGGESEAMSLLAKVIGIFRKKHPNVKFHLFSGNAEDVMERLDRGRLDFGVLIQPVDISKYDSLPLPVKDTWGLLMRDDHPLATQTEITPADLQGLTLLFSRQVLSHGDTHNPCLEWIGKTIDELDIAITYNLIFNAALLVRAGVGCAVTLDKLVNTTAQSDLCFRPFSPRLESSLDIVWKKHQVFSSAAAAFLEEVRLSLCQDISGN